MDPVDKYLEYIQTSKKELANSIFKSRKYHFKLDTLFYDNEKALNLYRTTFTDEYPRFEEVLRRYTHAHSDDELNIKEYFLEFSKKSKGNDFFKYVKDNLDSFLKCADKIRKHNKFVKKVLYKTSEAKKLISEAYDFDNLYIGIFFEEIINFLLDGEKEIDLLSDNIQQFPETTIALIKDIGIFTDEEYVELEESFL